jgi:sugar/nucleoside kinase (ribokinase family)
MGLGRGAAAVRAIRRRMAPSATLLVTDGPRPAMAVGPWGELERAPRALSGRSALGAGDAFSAAVIAEISGSRAGARDEAFWRRALDRAHAEAREAMRRGATTRARR